ECILSTIENPEARIRYRARSNASWRNLICILMSESNALSNSVAAAIEAGQDVLFDIDWQGGQQVRNSSLGKHVLSIFILPPSIPELERRLRSRGQDSDAVIDNRMTKSRDEISHWPEYDFVLVNDDLDATFDKLRTIVSAERLRLSQQPGLVDTVRRLNKEFEDRT
ncbi:MAG: guanylate kinase, partial [Paracoccaceae bacterium]|nr:guanylate kinase [Paracoccaceae bacterium]